MKKLLASFIVLLGLSVPVVAQWQIPDHTVPIGRGTGFTGFKNATPGAKGQVFTSTGAATDPSFAAPPIWTPEDFGALGDGVRIASSSVTINSGSTSLTVVGANFQTTDVGKVITIQSAGTGANYHTTTIATRVSATQVTIALSAVTTVAGVAKEVIYGTDDTAAFQAAATAMNAGTVRNFSHRPSKKYIVFPAPTNFQILMDLTSAASGLTYDGASAEVIIAGDTIRALTTNFMKITGAENIIVTKFIGTAVQGYHGSNPGMNWFSSTGAVENLSFGVDLNGGNSGIDCVRNYQGADTVFGKNVYVNGKITNITYGVQNRTHVNGFYVNVDTDNNLRSVIMYGNIGPTVVNLRSKNPKANDLDIVAYGHNTDTGVGRTANIKATYINVDSTTDFGNINLTHQQADPAVNDIATTIENVDITFYFNYPLAGANGSPVTTESWAGHSGASSLGNVAHVQRNITIRGEIRGQPLFAPMISIGTTALGWGNLGDIHWTIDGLSIPNANANSIRIGQFAKTTFFNIRAPNLPVPVFDAAPAAGLNYWTGVAFGSSVMRAITGTASEITVTNGDGVAGAPTISLPTSLNLSGKTMSNGLYSGPTFTGTMTFPSATAGIHAQNSSGVLQAPRTITGTTNAISVTNGDGSAGNPTLNLSATLDMSGKTILNGAYTTPTMTTPSLGVATATSINGVTLDNNAWTTYTPASITCGVSGPPTTSQLTGRWKQIGKIVFLYVTYTITALNGCSGDVSVSLPVGITPQVANNPGNGMNVSTNAAVVIKISSVPNIQFIAGSTAQAYAGNLVFEIQ